MWWGALKRGTSVTLPRGPHTLRSQAFCSSHWSCLEVWCMDPTLKPSPRMLTTSHTLRQGQGRGSRGVPPLPCALPGHLGREPRARVPTAARRVWRLRTGCPCGTCFPVLSDVPVPCQVPPLPPTMSCISQIFCFSFQTGRTKAALFHGLVLPGLFSR